MADIAHDYPFDPTHGYTVEQMLTLLPPAEPPDFVAFWQSTYDRTLGTPFQIEQSELSQGPPGFRVRELHYHGWDGVRLGAWLVEPPGPTPDRFVVFGHGYYNKPIEDISYAPNRVQLFLACRGLGLSRTPAISDQTARHVLHGIEHKETYVHRGCVADTWTAASVVLRLFPQAAGRLEYDGESFGGGIGAMALAWDRRFSFARLRVPSFGHMPIRLRCPCSGSGEAVRRKVEREPQLYDRTLRYFDAAVHARRITVPTFFACAAFDPVVPPPGQFAVYNATPAPKKLLVWTAGHHDCVTTATEVAQAAAEAERFRLASG